MKNKKVLAVMLVVCLLLIDQIIKIAVKTHMTLGQSIEIFDWFRIVFVENPGMAFGMTLGKKWILTTFRILVSVGVAYYLAKLVRLNYKTSYIIVISMVFAGAVGNIIDCVFYGKIFSESNLFEVATLFPADGGYAPLMLGRVVDMFYFPLFVFPEWVPLLGGEIFFSPIFNFADVCITVSMFLLILFFRKELNESLELCFPRLWKKDEKNK
ncbi:MAG: lipoprotein signal peptidase [Bacteroidales bacterium]|nr:lipoprotein signal peptidase [Bacteroidales bacterium]